MRSTVFAVLLAAAPSLAAQSPATIDTARIDSLVAADMAARRLVGVSIGLMRDGRVVFAKGYGSADREAATPVDTLTRFAIGSVTKEFTCAIVLQLAAEGKLSIDDPVSQWFPELTRAADIRLRDLMGHVSGYPDYYPLDFVDRRMLRPITADSLIRWYGRMPLDFEPGTRWSYSNTGFIILGRIAERVARQPFPQLLRERIFRPLGMTHTDYEPGRPGVAYAQGYASFALSDMAPAEPEANGWAAAAGGIVSTPSDLLLWDRALMEGRVVPPAFLAMMTTPRRLTGGASTDYGLGLAIRVQNGDTIWSHGGAVSGFAAQNTMAPVARAAVVVLSNAEATVSSGPLFRLVNPPRPAPPVEPSRPVAPPPSAEARPIPTVSGPSATEQATMLLHQLQAGHVDRSALGDEFSWWLNEARVLSAAAHLGPLGEPTRVTQISRAERGGLEVTTTRFTFGSTNVTALMYRSPSGKVEEYLIGR